MNARDQTDDAGTNDIGGVPDPVERLLERFRPAGPPAGLRQRVLAASESPGQTPIRPPVQAGPRPAGPPGGREPEPERPWRRVALYVWRGTIAAGLVAILCLNQAADQISTRTAGQVGVGPAIWTQDCEQTAQMLDGDGWGRRYLALALTAGPFRSETPPPTEGM